MAYDLFYNDDYLIFSEKGEFYDNSKIDIISKNIIKNISNLEVKLNIKRETFYNNFKKGLEILEILKKCYKNKFLGGPLLRHGRLPLRPVAGGGPRRPGGAAPRHPPGRARGHPHRHHAAESVADPLRLRVRLPDAPLRPAPVPAADRRGGARRRRAPGAIHGRAW